MTLSLSTIITFVVGFFLLALVFRLLGWALKTVVFAALLIIGLYVAFSILGINPFDFFK